MLSRLRIYLKERYPLLARLVLGLIVFLEIHFIILLNEGVTDFQIGIQEVVGAYTVFAFLLWLRIADDLKDFETDKKLFPDRPLARGAVQKKDVMILCTIVQAIAVILNAVFMNNLIFFGILYFYGYLMSKWFFQRAKIPCSTARRRDGVQTAPRRGYATLRCQSTRGGGKRGEALAGSAWTRR